LHVVFIYIQDNQNSFVELNRVATTRDTGVYYLCTMSTVQQLITDLSSLSTESKRRHPEIRQSCDKAISNLKAYNLTANVHEIDNPDLKSHIIAPFISACKTGNAKIATISIPAIHKLIVSGVVPSQCLNDLLDGLREATQLAVDIQLRILQCLPSLMQNYNTDIKGDLLIKLLGICSSLTSNNKSTVVINTASATLQQLFSNVFEKIDPIEKDGNIEIPIDEEKVILVDDLTNEGFQTFQDLCHLVENERPSYFSESMQIKSISVLEIIENCITSHKLLFSNHQELGYLLRIKLVPSLLRILNSPTKNFPLFTRTMRIFSVLLSSQLKNLEIESEIVLSFLNHILLNNEPNEDKLDWEKILVLEMYKGIFTDFNTVKSIFEKYDGNSKKKNVIQELTSILCNYLHSHSYIVNDSVKPIKTIHQTNGSTSASSSSTQNTQAYISKSTSNMKVSFLDHLDKMEPPVSIPQTYPVYLILQILLSYAEGVANFVQNLSNSYNPDTLEADVEFANSIIDAAYPDISSLFESFIYSLMDSDCFHLLIRSLQRYTHSAGLLGLGNLRDGLLMILSRAIINNASSSEGKSEENSSIFQEQGKQLLAFGESLVESFSGTLQSSADSSTTQNSSSASVKSRSFNTRHVTCLRALANLAVSLGSTLQNSWKIIWITFQWCDYYVYGPDEYSGYINNKHYKSFTEEMLPNLSSQDMSNFESSKRKLFDSIDDYPLDSYNQLLSALTTLSDSLFGVGKNEEFDEKKEYKSNEKYVGDDLLVCPYNKTFFLTNLDQICKINSNKFLIESNDSWKLVSDYFIKLGNTRSANYNLRIHIVHLFNSIITHIASQGFSSSSDKVNALTSQKSLEALNKFLKNLFDLGIPLELLVLNCETEIHLLILTTLHELIDKYDTYYQNSWSAVFNILNTPFKTTGSFNEDHNLKEKIRLLIDSSFATLKLILDEFMSTLPFKQLKLLIGTLFNFCSQSYDLNISFSSVSYFWLISDSLRSRISSTQAEGNMTEQLNRFKTGDEMEEFIETTKQESYLFYILLDVYLLSSLVELAFNIRAQVRDGAIQTFYQIIEIHGNLLTASGSWDLLHEIVFPKLVKLPIDFSNPKFHKKEWIDSLDLRLSGLVFIFNKFMINFDTMPNVVEKWQGLIKYFENLMEFKWIDLNLKIFKSFHDLVAPIEQQDGEEFAKVRDLLYEFWVGVSVEYDFINPLYQESIASLMNCFPPLYGIVETVLTLDQMNVIIALLNKCARYPVLPDKNSDSIRMSKLQRSVIENLRIIDSEDIKIQSQVIQQLGNIAVYPYGTRDRIAMKILKNKAIANQVKIPSFIAVSHEATKLMRQKLDKVENYQTLIEDKGINRVLKSLLEIIKNKSTGIEREPKKLWIESSEILKLVIDSLIREDCKDGELWDLIMSGIKLCISDNETTEDQEEINLKQYNDLMEIVFPRLLSHSDTSLVTAFVANIYKNSFLYEKDDTELDIINDENKSHPLLMTDAVTLIDFDETFGSTKPVEKHKNYKTRVKCLQELIKFCQEPENQYFNSIAQEYLICRASFCLRRFLSDVKLVYRCPMPKIQERELLIILNGIINITTIDDKNSPHFRKLYKLLFKLVPFSAKVKNLDQLLEIIFQRFLTV